jgi:hypothetical protein
MNAFLTAIRLNVLRWLALPLMFCAGAAFAQVTPQAGYWWNPATPGSGFVIEVQGTQMFMAGFLYAASGESTWVAAVGPMASSTAYSGFLITFSGGQTLTGNYQVPTQGANSAGPIYLTFTDDSHASLTWVGGTIPIERFNIVPGGLTAVEPETNPETGWWWDPSQSGRGFAIEVQEENMYLAGYMYDNQGNPTWYLASGPMASATLYQGAWTQYANGQTLTGPYQAPALVNPDVGQVTLQFIDTAHAALTLPNGDQIALQRFSFGLTAPVLTLFYPRSAAPNSLVTVTGSGIDLSATLSLTVFDNTGYTVTLPLASATTSNLQFAVPPYIDLATSNFSGGTVNFQLTQSSNGASVTSNTLTELNILALPTPAGTPGNATLGLIQANLAAAQKLQMSIQGTAQDTPAVEAEIAQQVSNIQTLVTNVQSVLQQGASFSLGAVGGVDITVTPANLSGVDAFILATLQSLASPGSGEKTAQTTQSGTGCLGAEAAALATAIANGTGNFQQLALNLLNAPTSSAACNTAAAFTTSYQIFGGAGGTGVGVTNEAAQTGGVGIASTFGLFASAITNADTALGLSALLAPQLASQTSSVQSGIGTFTALTKPITDQLLSSTSGEITDSVGTAQNLILTVAPPPTTNNPLAAGGSYAGSYTAQTTTCFTSESGALVATVNVTGVTLNGHAQGGGGPGVDFTGTYDSMTGIWSVTGGSTQVDGTISVTGTIVGSVFSGTVSTVASSTSNCPGATDQGVFAFTKQ